MPCVSIVENPHAHEFRCACAQFPSMVGESVGNFSRDSMGLSDSKKGEKIYGKSTKWTHCSVKLMGFNGV
jgi:hypothetical protein